MFNKDNTLPFVLAFVSTLTVLGLGYLIVAKTKGNLPVASNSSFEKAIPIASFSAPGIVPIGISVKINGVRGMQPVNKLLKKSFQAEFPGTTVSVREDGSETGIRLLLSGQIDIAAIDRALSEGEQNRGLTAVTIDGKHFKELSLAKSKDGEIFLYAYREPANFRVEAFLGHLFSTQGQEAIADL